MLSGRNITATLIGKTLEGSVSKCCQQRDILLPLLCCAVADEGMEVLDGNGCYTLGTRYTHPWKIPKYVLQLLQEALSKEKSGVLKLRYQSIHRKFSTLINNLLNLSAEIY
jgi:hypothetical protein